MSIGTPEILVCLLVALIVLGPDKLPKAARQVAKAVHDFKQFSSNMQSQVHDMMNVDLEAETRKADEARQRNVNDADRAAGRFADDDESDLSTDETHRDLDGFKVIDDRPPGIWADTPSDDTPTGETPSDETPSDERPDDARTPPTPGGAAGTND